MTDEWIDFENHVQGTETTFLPYFSIYIYNEKSGDVKVIYI